MGVSSMYKTYLTILLLAALFSWATGSTGQAPAVMLSANGTLERTIIEFELLDWEYESVTIGGRAYLLPRIPEEAVVMDRGAPQLPKVCRSLVIPHEAEMAVRVLDMQYHEVRAIIAPSKGSIARTVDPDDVPFSFGPSYRKDAYFPEAPARLGEPYILRDHRGVVVELFPLQYNPVTGTLRIHTSLTVEVAAVGLGKVNVKTAVSRKRGLCRAFHRIYSRHFLNYDSGGRYNPLDEEGGLLLICHDPWLSEVQPLVEYKKAIGMPAAAVGVSVMGNDDTAIKLYIQDLYRNSDLAFVLLVGDAEQVATPMQTVGGNLGSTDPDYALLEGNDSYPEIMVGRFSAETAAQVRTQVERTLTYESAPATGQPWFWKGMGVASDQGPGDDGEMDDEHIDNIRTLLMSHGYTEVDRIYDPDADALMVKEGLEAGRGIVNYCGHGGSGGWGTSSFNVHSVESLTNHHMLPFLTVVACSTGHFEGRTCIGEAFLRAEHDGKPTGAVGYWGGSISQYWSEPMEAQDELNQLLVDEEYAALGTVLYGGGCSMMDKYGKGGVDMFITWHLFGDPSVRVTGSPPDFDGLVATPFTGLYATGMQQGPFTPVEAVYTLTNHGVSPVDFAAFTDSNWIDLSDSTGTLQPGEDLELTVSINGLADLLAEGRHEAPVYIMDTADPKQLMTRVVILDVSVPVPVHTFDLDQDPRWARTGEWAFGQPNGQGALEHGYPDPTSGCTGNNVFGVNLEGDYSANPGGPYHLTTGAIDCTFFRDVSLRFMRWLNADFQPYFFSTVEVSNNGTDWVLVWENPGTEIAEKAWHWKIYDISHVADGEGEVYIRWGYEKGSPAYPYSGWNIDDIEIWGIPVNKKAQGKG